MAAKPSGIRVERRSRRAQRASAPRWKALPGIRSASIAGSQRALAERPAERLDRRVQPRPDQRFGPALVGMEQVAPHRRVGLPARRLRRAQRDEQIPAEPPFGLDRQAGRRDEAIHRQDAGAPLGIERAQRLAERRDALGQRGAVAALEPPTQPPRAPRDARHRLVDRQRALRAQQGIAVRQPEHVGDVVAHERALPRVARPPGQRRRFALELLDQAQAMRFDDVHARS